MKRSLRVRLKSEEVKDEKFFKELCNKRKKRRVHVRRHFLATTEGGCNINNNHLLLPQTVVIITRSTWRL